MSDPLFSSLETNAFGLGDAGDVATSTFADGDGDLDALVGNNNGDPLFFRILLSDAGFQIRWESQISRGIRASDRPSVTMPRAMGNAPDQPLCQHHQSKS